MFLKWNYYVGDFETTVYKGQKSTEVWASAVVKLFTEDVKILHSIDETFEYLVSLNQNIYIYYHNLKFDGSFWLSYLLKDLQLEQAYTKIGNKIEWIDDKEMKNKTFKYSISDMGQWYSILIKYKNHYIYIVDSLKLLPFSVKEIGRTFKTKHHKLDMEYTGFRYAGCPITDEEKSYIANDVLVIKEALEIMHNQGHKKLTIGSCCLAEFKNTIGEKEYYDCLFPDLTKIPLDKNLYGSENADEYIRKSYGGGWCYVVPEKACKKFTQGTTADVNSLYPSMMSSESGNRYPIGKPTFYKTKSVDLIPDCDYYFVRFRTRFYLKDGYLPFIHIRHSMLYLSTENLTTSDVYDSDTGTYHRQILGLDGKIRDTTVELTLSKTEYILFREHYDVEDFEIYDVAVFHTEIGFFDTYMNKYKKIKMESKGAIRQLAKLFLNNLYGKMATNTKSDFKVAFLKDDNTVGFITHEENMKQAGYIAIGSAITAYARNFTIRTAQKNYHGADRGFIYADTDSIHCDLTPDELIDVPVHPTNFCCWKIESEWDMGWFVRQKTYIERVIKEDDEPCEPRYEIKCAGLPERCKKLFIQSMEGIPEEWRAEYTEEQLQFIDEHHTIEDFNVGLKVPSKLMPKRILGGILLVETTYEMR